MADGYRITAQRQTTTLGASGQLQDSMVVSYELDDGTAGTVTLPLAGLTAEKVHAEVAKRVALHNSISEA